MAYHTESSGRSKAMDLMKRTGHSADGAKSMMRDHVGSALANADNAEDAKMVRSGIAQHERHDHPGQKLTRLRLADGGIADGPMADQRADKAPRGKGAKNNITIVIAPQAGQDKSAAPPMPMPPPPPPPLPPARPPMPPPGAMPPPGLGAPPMGMPPGAMPGPGGPPMGGPPMMRKHGGRTTMKPKAPRMPLSEMHGESESLAARMPPAAPDNPIKDGSTKIETAAAQGDNFMPGETIGLRPRRRSGGYVPPKMTAGTGSGEGRLQRGMDIDY